MGDLTFNGVSLSSFGFVIQTFPSFVIPSKQVEYKKIPGRNGSIIRDTETFDDVIVSYKIASAIPEGSTYVDLGRLIAEWLTSTKGYKRLTDTYDPLVYRMASYSDSVEFPNVWSQATGAAIQFNCKPQRYLLSGEVSIDLSGHQTDWVEIINPTAYKAMPEITMTLSSSAQTTISFRSNSSINPVYESEAIITGLSGQLNIYSEDMECFNASGLINNKVTINAGFPTLYPGANYIKYPSNVTSFSIVPRWWTL